MLTTAPLNIESLVATELPPLSSSAIRIATLAQDMNVSTRRLAATIAYDPAITARVLRAANSPLYAQEQSITALPTAVSALGSTAIHTLVMGYAASEAFSGNRHQTNIERDLWEHSVAVAVAARELISVCNMRGGDEAFLCGLLHDIGKMLLMRHDAESYEEVNRMCVTEGELLEGESNAYGYTHAQIGALVARRWNLPEEISYVIYYHHQPSQANQSMFMARVVDTADCLANRAGVGLRDESGCDLSSVESIIALNLSQEQLETVWQRTEANLDQVMHLFN